MGTRNILTSRHKIRCKRGIVELYRRRICRILLICLSASIAVTSTAAPYEQDTNLWGGLTNYQSYHSGPILSGLGYDPATSLLPNEVTEYYWGLNHYEGILGIAPISTYVAPANAGQIVLDIAVRGIVFDPGNQTFSFVKRHVKGEAFTGNILPPDILTSPNLVSKPSTLLHSITSAQIQG